LNFSFLYHYIGASVYIGEWNNGLRHGYGVLDDIVSGEKYMGMWSNDMKSGPGCVVTVDGVYYEGTFSHGKMTGKGLMMFEDETVYEGYLKLPFFIIISQIQTSLNQNIIKILNNYQQVIC
jgi:hypothetical protein